MLRALVVALGFAGCAMSYDYPHRRVVLTPEVAEDIAAVDLWRKASLDQYDPEVVISDTCSAGDVCVSMADEIGDCNDARGSRGCTHHEVDRQRIVIARIVPVDERVFTLAHELGHAMGLHHSATGIMRSGLPRDARLNPCVTADDVAKAGLTGPGACFEAP